MNLLFYILFFHLLIKNHGVRQPRMYHSFSENYHNRNICWYIVELIIHGLVQNKIFIRSGFCPVKSHIVFGFVDKVEINN